MQTIPLLYAQGHGIYQSCWHILGSGNVGAFRDCHGGNVPYLSIRSNLTALGTDVERTNTDSRSPRHSTYACPEFFRSKPASQVW